MTTTTITVATVTDEELRAMPRCAHHGREGCFAEDCSREHVRHILTRLRAVEAELREAKMMVDVWRASNAAMLATQVPRMIEQVCCCGGHRCGRGLP